MMDTNNRGYICQQREVLLCLDMSVLECVSLFLLKHFALLRLQTFPANLSSLLIEHFLSCSKNMKPAFWAVYMDNYKYFKKHI
jgi:hypothetical protein